MSSFCFVLFVSDNEFLHHRVWGFKLWAEQTQVVHILSTSFPSYKSAAQRGVWRSDTVAGHKKKWSVEMLFTDEERKQQTAKWGSLSSLACLIPRIKTIFTESRQCEKPAFHDKLRWVHSAERIQKKNVYFSHNLCLQPIVYCNNDTGLIERTGYIWVYCSQVLQSLWF